MYTYTPAVVDYQRTSAGLFSDILCSTFDGLALDVTQHKSTRLLNITYYNTACFALDVHWCLKIKENALKIMMPDRGDII